VGGEWPGAGQFCGHPGLLAQCCALGRAGVSVKPLTCSLHYDLLPTSLSILRLISRLHVPRPNFSKSGMEQCCQATWEKYASSCATSAEAESWFGVGEWNGGNEPSPSMWNRISLGLGSAWVAWESFPCWMSAVTLTKHIGSPIL
jgi:hypothetical protein